MRRPIRAMLPRLAVVGLGGGICGPIGRRKAMR